MTPVLDTHVLLWMALDEKRLSETARRTIQQASQKGGLTVASITLWEIAQLAASRRLHVHGTLAHWMVQLLAATGVSVLGLTPAVADLSTAFGPDFPRDPADRIIAATARATASPLITADERIRQSPLVQTTW